MDDKLKIIRYTYGFDSFSSVDDIPKEVIKNITLKQSCVVKTENKKSFLKKNFTTTSLYLFSELGRRFLLYELKNLFYNVVKLFYNEVKVSKSVLEKLQEKSKINFSSYSWADIMGGTGVWSAAIEQLSCKKVLTVDILTGEDLKKQGFKIYSKNRINENVFNLKLDKTIDAIFIRSGLRTGVLETLLKNNPHVKVLIYCEVTFSINGSVGLESLGTNYNKISIQNKSFFELDGVSNLKQKRKDNYVFHVLIKK